MNNMKLVFISFLAAVIAIVMYDCMLLAKQPIFADEYVFLKITNQLPKYDSTSEWLNDTEFSIKADTEIAQMAYEGKVWGHPPMGNLLVWPLVKIAGDFINKIWVYRVFYGTMMLLTVWLLADVIRRKFGYLIASFAMLPLLIAPSLLQAGIYVYHDMAMCLFLALSIWLIEVKPQSKWKYATATAMVLSKIYAGIFLVPLALLYWHKNWKVILCGFGLIPFLTYSWIVTSDPLYIVTHWSAANAWNWETFRVIVLPSIWDFVYAWGLYIHVPLVIGGIIAWARRMREVHWAYLVMYGIMVTLALNGGLMGNKTYPIMFGAIFVVVPLVQRILAKIEKKETELAFQ